MTWLFQIDQKIERYFTWQQEQFFIFGKPGTLLSQTRFFFWLKIYFFSHFLVRHHHGEHHNDSDQDEYGEDHCCEVADDLALLSTTQAFLLPCSSAVHPPFNIWQWKPLWWKIILQVLNLILRLSLLPYCTYSTMYLTRIFFWEVSWLQVGKSIPHTVGIVEAIHTPTRRGVAKGFSMGCQDVGHQNGAGTQNLGFVFVVVVIR